MKYTAYVREVHTYRYRVDADDPYEAREKALDLYRSDDSGLWNREYEGADVEPEADDESD